MVQDHCYSPELDEVYLYLKHPQGGAMAPNKIYMDGVQVTSLSKIEQDPNVDIVPVSISLEQPLDVASYHCYRAEYGDGTYAMAGLRTYTGEFLYGMCGAKPGDESDSELAKGYIQELRDHNINCQLPTLGSAAVREFLKNGGGQQMCKDLGIRIMPDEPGKWRTTNPVAFYVVDEPDCGEYRIEGIEWDKKVGTLAQGLVKETQWYRDANPEAPHLVNVNMTFKPFNWYTYGQLLDWLCADPYYQVRLTNAYWSNPERIPLYEKATYITAVAEVCQAACAPKPLFLLLRATACINEDLGLKRYATPEEKRIEVYYSIAAGTKGLGYWWYVPPNGLGSGDADAETLWTEIGVLGAEVRTAGPAIVRSCPVQLPLQGTENLWLRSLTAGTDTLLVICVNDDYLCDDMGTTVNPVQNASVSITIPSWLDTKDVFEINREGIAETNWQVDGSDIDIALGTVQVSRLLVITSDNGLKAKMKTAFGNITQQTGGGYWLMSQSDTGNVGS